MSSPADCPSILAVGAIDQELNVANFSNRRVEPIRACRLRGTGRGYPLYMDQAHEIPHPLEPVWQPPRGRYHRALVGEVPRATPARSRKLRETAKTPYSYRRRGHGTLYRPMKLSTVDVNGVKTNGTMLSITRKTTIVKPTKHEANYYYRIRVLPSPAERGGRRVA